MPENPESRRINEIKALNTEESALMEKFPPRTKVKVQRTNGNIEDGWEVISFVRKFGTEDLWANVANTQAGLKKSVPLSELDTLNP